MPVMGPTSRTTPGRAGNTRIIAGFPWDHLRRGLRGWGGWRLASGLLGRLFLPRGLPPGGRLLPPSRAAGIHGQNRQNDSCQLQVGAFLSPSLIPPTSSKVTTPKPFKAEKYCMKGILKSSRYFGNPKRNTGLLGDSDGAV